VEAIVPPKSALEQGLELRNRVQQALARKAP
jgi:hypothetical protein